MSPDADEYYPKGRNARFKLNNLSYGASLSDIMFSFVLKNILFAMYMWTEVPLIGV